MSEAPKWTSAHTALVAALVVFGASALIAWWIWPAPAPITGQAQPLPPAQETPAPATIPVDIKVVYVYPPEAKGKLGLPPTVATDPAKQVTATGKLNAEERPYTLTAVLDTGSGRSEVYARPDPQPWLGFSDHGAAGLSYGYQNGQPVFRLAAHQDFIRAGALRAGVNATLDSDGDWFAGLGVRATW